MARAVADVGEDGRGRRGRGRCARRRVSAQQPARRALRSPASSSARSARARPRVAADPRREPVGRAARVVIEADRGLLARGDARVGLPVLALGDQPEHDERHRDHRHDHDEHEEQPQPRAEAGQAIRRSPMRPRVGHLPRGSVLARAPARRKASASAPGRDARRLQSRGPPGAIAQLGERLDRTQEVGGSSPPSSIVAKPLHAQGFRVSGGGGLKAAIALRFRHQCLKTPDAPLIRVDRRRFGAPRLPRVALEAAGHQGNDRGPNASLRTPSRTLRSSNRSVTSQPRTSRVADYRRSAGSRTSPDARQVSRRRFG